MNQQYKGRLLKHLLSLGILLALFGSNAHAVPSYVTVIKGQYALGANLLAQANNCFLCHTNGQTGPANATLFGKTLRATNPVAAANIPNPVLPFPARLRAAEGLDSDGDGVSNLAEIMADTDPNVAPPPPVPATAPTVSLLLNNTTPTTGTFQTLTATLLAGTPALNKDIYYALVLPDGTLLVLQPNSTLSPAINPFKANVPVLNSSRVLLSYTFTGALPIGRYIWYAGLADPGTMNFNNSIVSTSFFFNTNAATPTTFIHTAAVANITTNTTTISNPALDGNPNAVFQVTQNWNPGGVGGTYNNHPIGVWYNGKWNIFNQDLAAMPVGAAFNVRIIPVSANNLVHAATTANITTNTTTITDPALDGNPNAVFQVTQNWNPGGVGRTYNNHPIGVWYNGGKWAIFNQDRAAMPAGAAFNIRMIPVSANNLVHVAATANIRANWTAISNPALDGNPNAVFQVTQNWNPGGAGGTYNNHPIGVWYNNGGKWAIFNQDLAAMPVGAAFNISIN